MRSSRASCAYYQRALTLSEGGQAERVQGMIVSGNYFTALRVRPALGRGFLPEEDKTPGTHPVVVLGYGLWQRRFGADPGLVGKAVSLNGYPFTVVGIAPSEFNGTIAGSAPDVYVPIMMMGQITSTFDRVDLLFGPRSRLSGWLQLLGPSEAGGQPRAGRGRDDDVLGSQIARAHPNRIGSPRVEPKFLMEDGSRGHTNLLRDLRFPLQMLMATVGLILLIACANVANLLLARAGTRQKEIAIRLATGAGRMRLIRQLLTESVLLSTLGGAAGLALAASISGLMRQLHAAQQQRLLVSDARQPARLARARIYARRLGGNGNPLRPGAGADRLAAGPGVRSAGRGDGLWQKERAI